MAFLYSPQKDMPLKRHLLCTFFGIIALVILYAFIPKAHHAAQGVILPAKTVLAPISPNDVTLYPNAPAGAKALGLIRVELAFNTLSVEKRDELLAKVKALAASVGANGVVVTVFLPGEGVRKLLTFYGTAVYVPGSKK